VAEVLILMFQFIGQGNVHLDLDKESVQESGAQADAGTRYELYNTLITPEEPTCKILFLAV
jgi:hypothetical protein